MSDLTQLAAEAATLVGMKRDGDGCWWITAPCDRFVGSDLLDRHAGGAILFDALLDWCAEQKMEPMMSQTFPNGGVWEAMVGLACHEASHPTKLGALLLALQAAGRIGGGA